MPTNRKGFTKYFLSSHTMFLSVRMVLYNCPPRLKHTLWIISTPVKNALKPYAC